MNEETFWLVYRVFNYAECAAWISIGLFLIFRYRAFKPDRLLWIRIAIPTFVLFGISDYVEAGEYGHVPYWLWCWKIICGAVLVRCRYGYIGIDRTKFLDSYSVAATLLLIAVLLLAFFPW